MKRKTEEVFMPYPVGSNTSRKFQQVIAHRSPAGFARFFSGWGNPDRPDPADQRTYWVKDPKTALGFDSCDEAATEMSLIKEFAGVMPGVLTIATVEVSS